MLAEERFGRILTLVDQRKSVTAQQLVDELGVSESTIRRDLNELDSKGRLIKVHGGAMSMENSYHVKDDDVILRKSRNIDDKIIIARYAASLIEPNDFVFIDAGTTTELMVDYLSEKSAVFVTNGMLHAKKLAASGFTTYMIGGQFKDVTEAIVGPEAIESIQKYNFTKTFMGTNGVSQSKGFSTPDISEAMVKETAMAHCSHNYVLADNSKFSQISCVTFAKFEDATIITTKLSEERYLLCKNVLEVEG